MLALPLEPLSGLVVSLQQVRTPRQQSRMDQHELIVLRTQAQHAETKDEEERPGGDKWAMSEFIE
jgi:hypothetical protein